MTFYILLHGPIFYAENRAAVANQIRWMTYSLPLSPAWLSLLFANNNELTHQRALTTFPWPLAFKKLICWPLMFSSGHFASKRKKYFFRPQEWQNYNLFYILFDNLVFIFIFVSFLFFLQAWDRLDGNKVQTKCLMTPSLDWEFELTKQVKPSSYVVLLPCWT